MKDYSILSFLSRLVYVVFVTYFSFSGFKVSAWGKRVKIMSSKRRLTRKSPRLIVFKSKSNRLNTSRLSLNSNRNILGEVIKNLLPVDNQILLNDKTLQLTHTSKVILKDASTKVSSLTCETITCDMCNAFCDKMISSSTYNHHNINSPLYVKTLLFDLSMLLWNSAIPYFISKTKDKLSKDDDTINNSNQELTTPSDSLCLEMNTNLSDLSITDTNTNKNFRKVPQYLIVSLLVRESLPPIIHSVEDQFWAFVNQHHL